LGRMHNYFLSLLIWFPFVSQSPHPLTYACYHLAESAVTRTLLFHTCYSCAGSVIRACTHNCTTYLALSHGDQHICFNSTYCPREQWLEVWSIHNPGNLVSCTQVFNPDEPVSVFFDACAAIDQGGCGGTGCLAWERDYMSNDKHMCQGDNTWPCDDGTPITVPLGLYVMATRQREEHTALFCKGQLPLTVSLAPVTL
jgi:hypothetical protein